MEPGIILDEEIALIEAPSEGGNLIERFEAATGLNDRQVVAAAEVGLMVIGEPPPDDLSAGELGL
jgi:hypothetical protein